MFWTSLTRLLTEKGYFAAIRVPSCQSRIAGPSTIISALNLSECLQNLDEQKCGVGSCPLLPQTRALSATKRHVLPNIRMGLFPSVGSKFFNVQAKNILVAMECVEISQ